MTHPRPHLVRARWLSLDGVWSFSFDLGDRGMREGWYMPGRTWPLSIEVPFPWESPRSGVGRPAPERYVRGDSGWIAAVGWYARRLVVPPEWRGERVWLVVGAAYWATTVWVDGQRIGEHEGGFTPFELDISAAVVAGEGSEIVLRVEAPEDTDEYPHGKNTRHWYSRASGIWQSVFVEPRPPVHVAALRPRATAATGELQAEVTLRTEEAAEVVVRLQVALDGAIVATSETAIHAPSGVSRLTLSTTVPQPRLWDIDAPTLYDVRVEVEAGDGRVDVAETTVGFRTITFEALPGSGARWLHLNGVPRYLHAVMSQGYHPEGIWAYPDESVIEQDLLAARRSGFDMVRLHVKVEDPRVLAIADRIGILLWCEMPDFLTPSSRALERWEACWRAMIERDAGHPSIALWCMFIESWGLGVNQFGFGATERRFADDVEMQDWVERMHAVGRSLDPDRPIIENSVCEADHTIAEVNDVHLFPAGYADLAARVDSELDPWVAGAFPGSQHNFAPGYRQEDQPLLVSSMAGWSCVDGVETSFPLRTLVNAVRRRERIAGYGWVQLYDVEWERTGLLTYDRRSKAFGFDVRDVIADDLLVVGGSLARSAARGDALILDVYLAHASGSIVGDVWLRAELDGLDATWRPMRLEVARSRPIVRVDRLGVVGLGRLEVQGPGTDVAGLLHLECRDAQDRVVARTFLDVAWLGPETPTALALPLERWEDLEDPADPATDVILVGTSRQRLVARRLASRFALPADVDSVRLLAEAAVVSDDLLGQTIEPVASHPVSIRIDGRVVATAQVPSLMADSRGSLSIVHPEGLGTYGGLLDVWLDGFDETLDGAHTLQLEVDDPDARLRVVLFGRLLGRAPLGPRLMVEHRPGPAD